MNFENEFSLKFKALSCNEGFARMAVSVFLLPYDTYSDIMNDIKTAVSEAVTNSIIHGYEGMEGYVYIRCGVKDNVVYIEVSDNGCGIDDIKKAMEPLYTSKPSEERSGLGFTVMESFMDSVEVESTKNKGTRVFMSKSLLR